MASSISSTLSSSANPGAAIHAVPGAKPTSREHLERGVALPKPQSGIHSVPAQPARREAAFNLDLHLAGLPTFSRGYELGKRLFDLSLAILILPILAALIAVIATAIASTAGAPIFFRHRRLGRLGHEFHIWKFRTMRLDSERHLADHLQSDPAAREEWNLTHKLRNDPRITRLGRFLRKTSLDELPQIFNIFAGNMSFVGPRPITRSETHRYADRLPCYLAALPGITGLWQVSGRCNLSYDARVALDEQYVRQWSLARDLAILLKTPRAVACRHGAY